MKNFVVYKLELNENVEHDGFLFDIDKLEDMAFKECQANDESTIGFVETPFGSMADVMSGSVEIVTVRTQKKSPNKAEIEHLIKKACKENKETYGSNPSRQQLKDIKDEAFEQVLMKTFPDKPVDILCFYCPHRSHLYVEVNSHRKGYEVIGLMTPFLTKFDVSEVLNNPIEVTDKFCRYIKGSEDLVDPFTFGNSVKLVDNEGRKIAITNGTIYDSEAIAIVENDGIVEELELDYDGVITFKVKNTMAVSGVKFSKELTEDCEEDPSGAVWLKIQEVRKLFDSLVKGLDIKEDE